MTVRWRRRCHQPCGAWTPCFSLVKYDKKHIDYGFNMDLATWVFFNSQVLHIHRVSHPFSSASGFPYLFPLPWRSPPASARDWAMPLPMPRLAPVTTPRQQDMSRNGKKWMFGDKNDDIMGIHMVTFMVICMYVYIHTIYIYYIYRYIHAYLYIYTHTYVCIYIHVQYDMRIMWIYWDVQHAI